MILAFMTITFVLQANRLPKCASHPKYIYIYHPRYSKKLYSFSVHLDRKTLHWFALLFEVDPALFGWYYFAVLFNFIQIYSLTEIKLSLFIFPWGSYFVLEKTYCYDDWNRFFFLNFCATKKNIEVDETSTHFVRISEKIMSYVPQFFGTNNFIKKWHILV